MTTPPLSAEQLEALRRYHTPTLSNAIEVFNIPKRHPGFLPPSIRCFSHADVRRVDLGKLVGLGGVGVRPGDLIHADKHGVCIIPLEIAAKLTDACAEVERLEKPLLDMCRSEDFDLEEYLKARAA